LWKEITYKTLQEGTDAGTNVLGFDGIEGWEIEVLEKRVGFDGNGIFHE
jgi:hypothetical protein